MAGDGRPRHCGRRADEAWPHGPYAYLPRGGICDNGAPRSRRPVAADGRPVIPLTARPDNGGAGQMRCHRQVPSGARPGAGPGRDPEVLPIAGTRPEGESRAPREETFNRVSARRAGSVTRHPQARPRPAMMWPPQTYRWHDHSHAVGRLGRSLVSAAGWPARHILPADYALRVEGEFVAAGRRGTAGSGASPALVFSCPGRIACGAPAGAQIRALRRGETLSLAVSCCWRQSQRGRRGSRAPVSEPARPGEPGPGSRRPQRVAGRRGRCQRGQPGKRAL